MCAPRPPLPSGLVLILHQIPHSIRSFTSWFPSFDRSPHHISHISHLLHPIRSAYSVDMTDFAEKMLKFVTFVETNEELGTYHQPCPPTNLFFRSLLCAGLLAVKREQDLGSSPPHQHPLLTLPGRVSCQQ
jgi:hypothetical protein